MADVTATEFTATDAVAIVFDRPFVLGELCILQSDRSYGRKRGSISRESCWQYAIEHIRSARDHFQQLRRRAQAHRITRLVVRQKRFTRLDCTKHFFFRFADADSANRVTIKIKIDNRLRTLLAQLLKHRALNNSEKELSILSWR